MVKTVSNIISAFLFLTAISCFSDTLGMYDFSAASQWQNVFTVVHQSSDGITGTNDGFVYDQVSMSVKCFDTNPKRDGGYAVLKTGALDAIEMTVSSDIRFSGANTATDTSSSLQKFAGVTLLGRLDRTRAYFAGWANNSSSGTNDKLIIGIIKRQLYDPDGIAGSGDEYWQMYQYDVLNAVEFPTLADIWASIKFTAVFDQSLENVSLTAVFFNTSGCAGAAYTTLTIVRNLAVDNMEAAGEVGIARPGPFNGYGWFDNFKVEYSPVPFVFELLEEWVLDVTNSFLVWTVNGAYRVPERGFALPSQFWDDGSLIDRLPDMGKPALSIADPINAQVNVSACIGEYEPFQLVITAKEILPSIDNIVISDLVRTGGSPFVISSANFTVNKVGYVWGINELTGQQSGPYRDVLLPLSMPDIVEFGKNYNLWFTIFVPSDALPGTYSGSINISFDGLQTIDIPVVLKVWAFHIPHKFHVNSQLFSMDIYSLCYYYGLAPWQDEAQALFASYTDNLLKHRISPSKTPALPRPEYEKYPTRGMGSWGNYLQFNGKKIDLPGPKDELFRNGFTLSFWLKTYSGCDGEIIKQNWFGRPSGWWIKLTDGRLEGKIGFGNASPDPLTAQVSASWPGHNVWHHVALVYGNGQLGMYIDGNMSALTPISFSYSPALTFVSAGSSTSNFDIDEIRWCARALNAQEVSEEKSSAYPLYCDLHSLDFEDASYDFSSKLTSQSSQELDREWFWQFQPQSIAQRYHLNNLPEPVEPDENYNNIPEYSQWYYQQLYDDGVLDEGFVKLPRDESVSGSAADVNRLWADRFKQSMPQLRRLHTFGSMGTLTWAQREQAIQSYIGYVDIWSMVPYLFAAYYNTYFDQRQQLGDKFSMYIHRVDEVETNTVLFGTRIFSWYFWKYDLDMCTYWTTNLWFQCVKPGVQAERRTWQVENGIKTTTRNNSISNGALFWPGTNGVLNSLRVENWRDGFEDYEYVWMLKDQIEKAAAAGRTGSEIDQAVLLYAQIKQMQIYGYNWDLPPTEDPSLILNYRERIAILLEQLQDTANTADINLDGIVDIGDLAVAAEFWCQEMCSEPHSCGGADIDGTGEVNLLDFSVLMNNWQWKASWK